MRYICVKWLHDYADEPIAIYSELNASSWETRKVEILRGGRMDYASGNFASGNAGLSKEPLPNLDEIASDPQFVPMEISSEEFERVWQEAVKKQEGSGR